MKRHTTIEILLLIGLCFSGAAALIYEVVWTRALSLVMGSTTYALSTMLASFMTGLTVGGYAGGIWADRAKNPAFIFALLEVGIAIFGLATFIIIKNLSPVYAWSFYKFHLSFSSFSFIQFILSFVVMLIPTTLMGATFPVVLKARTKALDEVGREAGDVYSVNNLGAVIGSFSAGFILIPSLGSTATVFLAGIINLLVGSAILIYSGRRWKITGCAIFIFIAICLAYQFLSTTQFPFSYYTAERWGSFSNFKMIRERANLLFHREGVQGDVMLFEGEPPVLISGGKLEGGEIKTHSLIGYLALASHPSPEKLLNIGLGSGNTLSTIINFGSSFTEGEAFNYLSSLTLQTGEDKIISSSVDIVNGYMYVGTDTSPGQVIKIRLSDFTRVGAITLSIDSLWGMAIDTTNGFLYVSGNIASTTNISKIDLTTFTETTVLSLTSELYKVNNLVIDISNGFLYIGTGSTTDPAEIRKINLTTFTQTASLTLNSGENTIGAGIIYNGYIYYSARSTGNNAEVIQIRISDFTRIGSVSGVNLLSRVFFTAKLDLVNGYGYFVSDTTKIVKVNLSLLTIDSILQMPGINSFAYSSSISNNYLYIGRATGNKGYIDRIRLSDFTLIDSIEIYNGNGINGFFIGETFGNFIYFAGYTSPGVISKIRILGDNEKAVFNVANGKIDSVEISPEVIEATRLFIRPALFSDPKINHIVADARNFLLLTSNKYDIIISVPSWPVEFAPASLLTEEFFSLAKGHLDNNGIFVQWVDYYLLSKEDMRIFIRTFSKIFPSTTIWHTAGNVIVLVGSEEPSILSTDEIKRKVESLAPEFTDTFSLGMTSEQIRKAAWHIGQINTDDYPVLEFHAAKAIALGEGVVRQALDR